MRTSTVIFLVLFLCLYSSSEHRSKLRTLAAGVRQAVCEIGGDCRAERASRDFSAEENAETRELRERLKDVELRDAAAQKALRTVDRSVRSLEERIRKAQKDVRSDSRMAAAFSQTLDLLIRQRDELEGEKAEIESLQEALKSTAIRLQAEIDLASIRAERREVEAFLDRERGSPIDRLAAEGDYIAR